MEAVKRAKNIKISVIMGVYNPTQKQQLFAAVRSIIGQTFPWWEMIIYDDGSSPDYAETIREAAALDDRIVYMRENRNRGLAYALNQCIMKSRGKYIARMDADDISKPDRLERLYDFLENHREYAWVGSNSELFNDQGVWGTDRRAKIPQNKDFLPYSPYIHPAVAFRKSVLIENQGYKVSETTRRCEDYELFMRLQSRGYHGYNIQEPLLQYREDCSAYRKRRYKFYIQEMKVRYNGFKKLGILRPGTMIYAVKPLFVGLVSPSVMQHIKKKIKRGG